jgi:uncharacterized membrane protein HdeD (DUF308 family)
VRDDALTPEQIGGLSRMWWLPVCVGVLSVIAGGLVLARPDNSLRALAVIVGIFVLIDGSVELYLSFARDAPNSGATAVLAVLNVIVGVMLIRHPIAGVQAVALFIGIWLIAVGVVRVLVALDSPGERLGRLILAGIEILAGIVIVSSSHISFATLALLVGLSFIANGLGLIVFGFLMRTLKRDDRQRPGVAVAT